MKSWPPRPSHEAPLDANVLLSYMPAPTAPRVVATVVTACFARDEIDLLVSREQIDEFVDDVWVVAGHEFTSC